jgi:hypothetical protein
MNRYTPGRLVGLKGARSGPEQLQQKVLFDHFVGNEDGSSRYCTSVGLLPVAVVFRSILGAPGA